MISYKYKCIFIHQRKCAGKLIIRHIGVPLAERDRHRFNDGTIGKDPDSD